MAEQEKDKRAVDENQQEYRQYFGIVDKYLIQHSYDPTKTGNDKSGYIIFIDYENDIDYIDLRNEQSQLDAEKEMNRYIAKLQLAEAVPTKHLPEAVQMEFKRSLGVGYIHALNSQFEDIPNIIAEAQGYLKQRGREYSRKLFLASGLPAVIIALGVGLALYCLDYKNPWLYGIVFSVLGAFTSIWLRYGRVNNSGYGGNCLHHLECYARIIVGVVFSLIAMVAIRCKLIFPVLDGQEELFAFIIASFVAAFSERFIPSVLERFEKNNDNENTNENK